VNDPDITCADPALLRSALDLTVRAWHVLPCAPGDKRPALQGSWQDLATVAPDRIRVWWTRRPYNIGIVCGPSGLAVIDLDVSRDGYPSTALEATAAARAEASTSGSTTRSSPATTAPTPRATGTPTDYQPTTLPDLSGGTGAGSSSENGTSTAGSTMADDPGRRLVIEGNRAWTAACTVRKRWLTDTLLARRTAPKQAMPFITAQLLTMPQPLRDALTRIPTSSVFHELTGGTMKAAETAAWATARLPLALLAVITAAYEDRMGGDGGRETWRTDRPYPVPPGGRGRLLPVPGRRRLRTLGDRTGRRRRRALHRGPSRGQPQQGERRGRRGERRRYR
jgi:hypothetical protein